MAISDLNKDLIRKYTIDFSTPQKYVESLNNIRRNLGTPLQNINQAGTTVYQLPPPGISTRREGVIISMMGVEDYGSTDPAPVRFVLDPVNLYLVGFIHNDIFFRLRGHDNILVEEGIRVVPLNQDSTYGTLERVGDISRRNIEIHRANLVDGYSQLARFTEQTHDLNRESARGLLRYMTIISEALRFRQIQRNFRESSLERIPTPYRLNGDNLTLTINWDGLSSGLPLLDAETATSIRSGRIALDGIQNILSAIGMALHCSSKKFIDNDMCDESDSIVINKVVWDKKTLLCIL